MEWISVKERLPELPGSAWCSRIVICCDENGYVLPLYWERGIIRGKPVERWKYVWDRIYNGRDITHWMPLPEPPKEA